MKKYKQLLLKTAERERKLIEDFFNGVTKTIEDFDMESTITAFNERKEMLISKAKDLGKELNGFFTDVRNSLVDCSFTVPYNKEKGESIEYDIVDGKLVVSVSCNDGEEEYTRTRRMELPELEGEIKLNTSYDPENHTFTITIKSSSTEAIGDDEDDEEEEKEFERFVSESDDEEDEHDEGEQPDEDEGDEPMDHAIGRALEEG